ncbi:hypothetical protein C2E23DRAFT_821924 [Lenzites betulinus]|nr:hypothetical protein C2E23DRAFT_821924 [Lenzites betulinus]
MASPQPNTSLYIKNLNDKVKKEELRAQLFALFTTYGRILDVFALKGPKMRARRSSSSLTSRAPRRPSGAAKVWSSTINQWCAVRLMLPRMSSPLIPTRAIPPPPLQHIEYAKPKSYATLRREDPSFVPPTSIHLKNAPNARALNGSEKRQQDDRMDEDARESKRQKTDNSDDDGEEMEIEDDDNVAAKQPAPSNGMFPLPSARLMCVNLPQEVTDDVLSVLFQQYQGYHSVQAVPSPTPTAAGQRAKMAYVTFESPDLASVAKEAPDGFTLKKGWVMSVSYI